VSLRQSLTAAAVIVLCDCTASCMERYALQSQKTITTATSTATVINELDTCAASHHFVGIHLTCDRFGSICCCAARQQGLSLTLHSSLRACAAPATAVDCMQGLVVLAGLAGVHDCAGVLLHHQKSCAAPS
jgi:hypothetical protein